MLYSNEHEISLGHETKNTIKTFFNAQLSWACSAELSMKEVLKIVSTLRFISKINFMLSWVEHERSFITSGLASLKVQPFPLETKTYKTEPYHVQVLSVWKKVREKSRECHNHKPQPFPDTMRKRKRTNPNKRKSNKRMKRTNIMRLCYQLRGYF